MICFAVYLSQVSVTADLLVFVLAIHKESDATNELEADGQQAYTKTMDDEETTKTANAGI